MDGMGWDEMESNGMGSSSREQIIITKRRRRVVVPSEESVGKWPKRMVTESSVVV